MGKKKSQRGAHLNGGSVQRAAAAQRAADEAAASASDNGSDDDDEYDMEEEVEEEQEQQPGVGAAHVTTEAAAICELATVEQLLQLMARRWRQLGKRIVYV